jgi:hypothetical protein
MAAKLRSSAAANVEIWGLPVTRSDCITLKAPESANHQASEQIDTALARRLKSLNIHVFSKSLRMIRLLVLMAIIILANICLNANFSQAQWTGAGSLDGQPAFSGNWTYNPSAIGQLASDLKGLALELADSGIDQVADSMAEKFLKAASKAGLLSVPVNDLPKIAKVLSRHIDKSLNAKFNFGSKFAVNMILTVAVNAASDFLVEYILAETSGSAKGIVLASVAKIAIDQANIIAFSGGSSVTIAVGEAQLLFDVGFEIFKAVADKMKFENEAEKSVVASQMLSIMNKYFSRLVREPDPEARAGLIKVIFDQLTGVVISNPQHFAFANELSQSIIAQMNKAVRNFALSHGGICGKSFCDGFQSGDRPSPVTPTPPTPTPVSEPNLWRGEVAMKYPGSRLATGSIIQGLSLDGSSASVFAPGTKNLHLGDAYLRVMVDANSFKGDNGSTYSYTAWGAWGSTDYTVVSNPNGRPERGYFVFGRATSVDEMPKSGSAFYSGDIRAIAFDGQTITGAATFAARFGTPGSQSGSIASLDGSLALRLANGNPWLTMSATNMSVMPSNRFFSPTVTITAPNGTVVTGAGGNMGGGFYGPTAQEIAGQFAVWGATGPGGADGIFRARR